MLHLARQIVRVVSTGCAYASFFLGGALLGWIVLPIVSLSAGSQTRAERRCRRVVRSAWILFHDVLRIFRVLDYDPRRVRGTLPAGPCLLVSNHPSLLDVTAIAAALPDLTLVAKTSMYRAPVLGRLLRLCGYVEADDRSPFSGAATAAGCLAQLEKGVPVLIFPEGTRSPARGLGAFGTGAFQIAERARVPVVPLLIRFEPPNLLRGQAWYAIPSATPHMTVEILPPTPPGGVGASEVARRLREVYGHRLGYDLPPTEARSHEMAPDASPTVG